MNINIPVIIMIARSGWIARIILILLGVLSILTWTIIFNRFIFLKRIKHLNTSFLDFFEQIKSFSSIKGFDRKFEESSLGLIGSVCFEEYRRITQNISLHKAVKDWNAYLDSQFKRAAGHVSSVAESFAAQFDKGLYVLAVTSSIAPFLGLLGTVWGIMNSFFEIGKQGTASLPVVAPGIAEALITTIVGLGVAIPSLFFYNIFVRKTESLKMEMNEYGENLIRTIENDITDMVFIPKNETQ